MANPVLRALTVVTVATTVASCAATPSSVPPLAEPPRTERLSGNYQVQQYGALFSQRSQWVYHGNRWRYLYPGRFHLSGWVYTLLPWWGWVWVWFPMSYTGWIYVWSFGWAYIGGFAWPGGWGGPWQGGPGPWAGDRSGARPLLARPGGTVDLPAGFSARGTTMSGPEGASRTLRAPASTPGSPPFGGARPSGAPGGAPSGGEGPSGGPPGFTPGGGPMGYPPGGPPR